MSAKIPLRSILPVLAGSLFSSLAYSPIHASPTDPGGFTYTNVSAEACRAYNAAQAASVVHTLWGIRNSSTGSVWVACPATAQQPEQNLDSNDLRYMVVGGYVSDPGTQVISCQVRVEDQSTSASYTQSGDLNHVAVGPGYEWGFVPSPGSWPDISTPIFAPRTILWCLLPPGAYLYDYTLVERVVP